MKKIILGCYCLLLLVVCWYGISRPLLNWDMLPYMGIVIGYDHKDASFAHDTVYSIVRHQAPASDNALLVDGGLEYRRRMAASATAFRDQYPYYVVKPLYTRLIQVFFKLGLPLLKATILPSLLSYFLIGVLVLFWSLKFLKVAPAVAVSTLIMLTAPMWEVARMSSPDCLSAFLLFASLCALENGRSIIVVFALLVLSIFARLDNFLFSIFLLAVVTFSERWPQKISKGVFFLMLLLIVVCCFSISYNATPYGWSEWYYPSFSKSLNTSYSSSLSFHLNDYVHLIVSHVFTGLFYSNLILFVVLALLFFLGQPGFHLRRLARDQLLLCVIFLTIFVRFLLQPVVADRLYIAYYLYILVLCVKSSQTAKIHAEEKMAG